MKEQINTENKYTAVTAPKLPSGGHSVSTLRVASLEKDCRSGLKVASFLPGTNFAVYAERLATMRNARGDLAARGCTYRHTLQFVVCGRTFCVVF